jgi:hypothetical protein
MKRLLLLIGILLPSLVFSQSLSDQKQDELLDQGRLSAGVNAGGAFGGNPIGAIQYLAPHIQYFIKDGWSIALGARHNVTGNFLRYTGFGLSSRYYFVRDRRLALFGQLGATIGQSKFSLGALDTGVNHLPIPPLSYERYRAWQTTAGLGVHFRIAKRWSLESLGERAVTQFTRTTSYRRWQGSIGINFLLK